MHFTQLRLTQFRNYEEMHLALNPGIICLAGPNGAGKSNVLDALHYLAFTKGFRSNNDKQAIQKGNSFFWIEANWVSLDEQHHIQCNFISGKGKNIRVDQQLVKKMSAHIGRIPMVAILPGDTDLISGASVLRRRFVDMLISQYDANYLHHLIQYEKILTQRNALLKLFAEHRMFDKEQLSLFDDQLIPHGIAIIEGRDAFIELFSPIFSNYFNRIASIEEKPFIKYRKQVIENTRAGWMEMLSEQLEKDRALQYSGAGTHRDDLIFSINEQSVRNFGSQGQQKTFIISLKLAQYQLLAQQTQLNPILLLDDIFDKLDEQRLKQISFILEEEIQGQVFITDTSLNRLQEAFSDLKSKNVYYFQVNQATISPLNGSV